jgi:hypothetical protein
LMRGRRRFLYSDTLQASSAAQRNEVEQASRIPKENLYA